MYSAEAHVPGSSGSECRVAGGALPSTSSSVWGSLCAKICWTTKTLWTTKGCRCARESLRGKISLQFCQLQLWQGPYFLTSCVTPQNKKRKSRGKGKKTSTEGSRGDDGEEDDREAVSALQKGGGREGSRGEGESLSKPSAPSLYPSWKLNSSDSEFSDMEGNAQSKLRYSKTLLMSIHVTTLSLSACMFFCLKVKAFSDALIASLWA